MTALRRSTWHVTAVFALEWLVIICVGSVGYYIGKRTPRPRPFRLDDPSISYPFTLSETVPSAPATILDLTLPTAVFLLWALLSALASSRKTPGEKSRVWCRKLWELHLLLLGFASAYAFTRFATDALKVFVGRLRPDFLSRCDPDVDRAPEFHVSAAGAPLVTIEICQNTLAGRLVDGMRSFPSGHASGAATTMVYLSLFLADKLGLLSRLDRGRRRCGSAAVGGSVLLCRRMSSRLGQQEQLLRRGSQRPSSGAVPLIFICVTVLLPFGVAVYVAASRWVDFRHHPTDIVFGFLLGAMFSLAGYWIYKSQLRSCPLQVPSSPSPILEDPEVASESGTEPISEDSAGKADVPQVGVRRDPVDSTA